ncbi:MAG: hypothetical protein ACKORJ_01450 [Bacteroidota bacterium]
MTLRTILLLAAVATTGATMAQVKGCNDPLASNYNSAATVNDGSCTYTDTNITPTASRLAGGVMLVSV